MEGRGSLVGPGSRPPCGASKRKPNTGLHCNVPVRAPALRDSSLAGSRRREPGIAPAGLENATGFRAPATSPLLPLLRGAPGTWPRVCGLVSRADRPWPPLGGRAIMAARGPGAPDWELGAGSVPGLCCVVTWRLPRPRPQQRPGSPGRLGGQAGLLALPLWLRRPLWRGAGGLPACLPARGGAPSALRAPDPPCRLPQAFQPGALPRHRA